MKFLCKLKDEFGRGIYPQKGNEVRWDGWLECWLPEALEDEFFNTVVYIEDDVYLLAGSELVFTKKETEGETCQD